MKTFHRFGTAFLLLCSLAVCAAADVEDGARLISRQLRIEEGHQVADLGAGDGEWSVALSRIVGERGKIFATEVEQNKVDKLHQLVERRKIGNIQPVLGSQDSTGLEPGSVNSVLIRRVYHHFSEPEKMHEDLKRALRPGGRIAIIDFGPENRFPRSSVPEFRKGHGVTAEKIIEEMSAAGFRLEDRKDDWDRNDYLLVFSLPPH